MDEAQLLSIEAAISAAVLPLETRLAEIQTQQKLISETIGEGGNGLLPKKVKLNKDKDDKSDKLDPVTIGDLIYLRNTECGEAGYLIGDHAYSRCGMQVQGKGSALNFDDYVFRVCPMLSYRYANEYEAIQSRQRNVKMKKLGSGNGAAMMSRQLSVSSLDDYTSEAPQLLQRVQAEKDANNNALERVIDGVDKEVVIFGALCQLQHVKSGLFLSVREEAAPLDPDCRSLSLAEGSSASYLRVMPCFKAQTEGSATYYTHSVVLESGKYQGMYVHVSPVAHDSSVDPEDPLLPKCLRTGRTFEANISAHPSTFTVFKYGRFEDADSSLLKTSQPFRLYHPQGESFVLASCDQQKDLRGATREGGIPLHIPYLKAMVDNGSDPDPSNPFNHNAKGVWCFEPLHRFNQTVVPWNSPVRVRHMPSGLYLAVDSTKPLEISRISNDSGGNHGEVWYSTYLVEDAMDSYQSEFADAANLTVPENMIFHITSADRMYASHIPRGDISIRLEHHIVEEGYKQVLYLSNTEQRKPSKMGAAPKNSVFISSYQLVFSNILSVQDIFRMIPVSVIEERSLNYVKSLLIPCSIYVVAVSNPDIPISRDFKMLVSILLSIIDLQHKGTSHHDEVDWIKRANSMMPAAFSALFDGDPNQFVQRVCRDMKLMDVVFSMGCAPYHRSFPDSPWLHAYMDGPKGIQKLIHVALQRMCFQSQENQLYFGKRTSRARGSGGGKSALGVREALWMETILEQLEDPLGSAVTLSKLLSANSELLRTYATPKLVLRFADLVRNLGPQPRLVNFFNSICTVDGEAVMANQEMVLRLTWMRKETRQSIFLNVVELSRESVKPELQEYHPVRLPSGEMSDSLKQDFEVIKPTFPKNYIGKGTYESTGGFNPVFVSWTGIQNWVQGVDELWFNPVSMNIPEYDTPEGKMVRLEDLCWVLNGPSLCEPVTGISWKQYTTQRDSSKAAWNRWANHHQLASYFVGQLTLHCSMVTGRSSSCMIWLEDAFSYTMLASICHNVHLPQQVRAAATDFLRGLYLDRYPQLHKCGRPSLPEALWVYSLSASRMVDADAVPYIKDTNLSERNSLPRFMISKSHPLYGHSNPFHGFPTMSKFFLLRHLTNDYLKSFGTGRLVYHNRNESMLAGSICRVVSELLSFGFLSSLPMFKSLLPILVRFLDGRNDVENLEIDEVDGEFEFIPFDPPKRRYAMSSDSPSVTSLKLNVLNTLMDVADIRSNFRLSKFLNVFKKYNEDPKLSIELKRFHVYFKHDKETQYNGPLTDRLYDEFESLFEKGDGFALQFEELAGTNVNTVLLDCLMYDDDKLFSSALQLLERAFTQRTQVLKAVSDTILLHQGVVPVFGQVDVMIAEMGYLGFLAKSYTSWGICSRVSGAFIPEMNVQFLKTCDRILEFLLTKARTYEEEKQFLSIGSRAMTKKTTFSEKSKRNDDDDQGKNGDKVYSVRENAIDDEEEAKHNSPLISKKKLIKRFEPDHDHELEDLDEKEEDDVEMTNQHSARGISGRTHHLHHLHKLLEHPEKLHQDILRSLNLHAILHEGLRIDYNLVFKGSICSFEQKVQSRKILVAAQRKIIDVLVQFVKGNEVNQKLIFSLTKNELMHNLGLLRLPVDALEEDTDFTELGLPHYPGMGAERVIIECMRGNSYICEELIPRSLFVTFGNLLAASPDPSDSYIIEFFDIVCRPNGPGGAIIARNQFYALDVLLSSELPQLRNRVEYAFGVLGDDGSETGSEVDEDNDVHDHNKRRERIEQANDILCRCPERLAGLLATCICGGNMQTASMLQFNKMTMDANLSVMERLMEKARAEETTGPTPSSPTGLHRSNSSRRGSLRSLQHDPRPQHQKVKHHVKRGSYLANMIMIFSYQMDTLVIDPRIYRRPGCWDLVAYAIGSILANFIDETEIIENSLHTEEYEEHLRSELRKDIPLVKEGIRIALRLMTGARSLGIQDFMILHDEALLTSPKSVMKSTLRLLQSSFCSSESGLRNDAESLLEMMDSSYAEGTTTDLSAALGDDSKLVQMAIAHHYADEHEQLEEEELDMSGTLRDKPPREMLQYMTEALSNNPKVMLKLQYRRFQFAEVLEQIEEKTDPAKLNREAGDTPQYGVKISWGELVDRMMRYVQHHNFDTDESHIIRIFEILRSSVLRARCDELGKEIPFDNGSAADRPRHEKYTSKQRFLDSRGVTHAAAVAISTHAAGIEGNAADAALELLKELLFSGNTSVQNSVYNYVCDDDKDAKFLGHFKTRMAVSQDIIKERKKIVANRFESMTEPQREGYANAKQTFAVLQQLCEGHNTVTQDLLRTQPKHRKDINLVNEILKMFTMQAGSGLELLLMESAEVDLLVATMDLLTELLQGPCKGNQEFVTRDESFMHSMETVLQSNFHARVNKGLRVKVKSTAMVLLAALLEGRSDLVVHKKMAEILEVKMFELVHGYFSRTLRNTIMEGSGKLNDEVTSERVDEIMVGVVCLKRVVGELGLVSSYKPLSKEVLDEQRHANKGVAAFDHVAVIEVSWKGRIESVSFPMPPEVDYLSQQTKDKFLSKISLETAEKRMKALLQEAPIFISEMTERSHLANNYFFYKVLSKNIAAIKWCMYALVVLLNTNVVMASYGERHRDKGYRSAVDALFEHKVSKEYVNSLIITWVLGIINACGYVVIVMFLAVTEIPMIIRQTDQLVKTAKNSPVLPYNPKAFTWWGVTLAGNIMFIIMHMANYPGEPNYILYYFLVFGINLPWTLTCVRRYIVVPTNKHARMYVIFYDTVMKKPFFRNHVLLMTCSVLGFNSTPFFTLMLLDIVNNSQVLKDIIRSITRPLPQLAVVFFTFVITVVIYAQFGVTYFEEWFQYDSLADDGEKTGCHSVVSCFWLIFYLGVPIGQLSEVLDNVSNKDGDTYLSRVAFDLSFFVWVGILLFNVITGLIVDTFSTLREEAGKREDILINSCFVCGYTRTGYDDLGITNAPSFDMHKKEVHFMWNYVYFYFYLTRKDPTEYNGVESYVSLLLEEQSLAWIPQRSTLASQHNQHQETDEGEDNGGDVFSGGGGANHSGDLRQTFKKEIGALGAGIKELIDRVEQLEAAITGEPAD